MTTNADEIKALDTPALIERFCAAARRMPTLKQRLKALDLLNPKPRSPDPKAASEDLHAVARELRARNAVSAVRPLYESDEDRVRLRASSQFPKFDPELAQAAFYGVQFGVPTREVVALTRRARATLADAPSLTGLSVDALVAAFVDASTRLSATRFLDCVGEPDDLEVRNRIVVEVSRLAHALNALGALARLAPLMDDPNDRVRIDAAMLCLATDTGKARAILDEAATRSRDVFDRMDAERALRLWAEGKLVLSGDL